MVGIGQTFHRTRAAIRNWYTAGILASIVMPTRIPPRQGMAGTWLGRRFTTFRLRDGSRVTCRLQDAGDLVSVYVDQDYAPFAIPWPKVRTIIDVGATTGCFTLWAHSRAPDARILAIEPNSAVYPFLVKNVSANGLVRLVQTRAVALGSSPGFGEVIDDSYSTFATVVQRTNASPTTVAVTTLERVMKEADIDTCDLLKLDIEGGEYDVILSATQDTLRRVNTIVCEFHPVPHRSVEDLVQRLRSNGFHVLVSGGPIGFIFGER